jgi:GNAT superfamily N-acetyltransferase
LPREKRQPLESLAIVRVTKSHVGEISSLFDDYRRFYGQRSNLPAAKRFLEERLAKEESVIFLALQNELPVGFAQLYPSFSSVSMKPLWILNDLFVAPAARRGGVASALLKKSEQLAKRTRAKELVLETSPKNIRAQRLYGKLGWKLDKTFLTYRLSMK